MVNAQIQSAIQPPLARPATGYIPTLDGWRAIAILGVMLFHGGALFPSHPFLSRLQNLGANGVQLFFGISGLLICSRLAQEEHATGTVSLRAFYLRRLFRIQPAALTYLVAVAILSAAGVIAFSSRGWWSALLSVRNLYQSSNPADGAVYTAHFWSLAVEEHFYLVMPWLLIGLREERRVRWFGCLAAAFLLLNEFAVRTWISSKGINSESELCWLFLAAWLALVIRQAGYRERFQRYLPSGPVFLVVCLIGLGTALRFRFVGHLWLPSFPLLLLSTILNPGSVLSRILEWNPLRVLGLVSYSLYLWQELFCVSLTAFPQGRWPLGWMQHHPQSYIFPVGLAFFSYFFVERPFLQIGARFRRQAAVRQIGAYEGTTNGDVQSLR